MKSKIAILSTLFCIFGVSASIASDCLWDDCAIGPQQQIELENSFPKETEVLLIQPNYKSFKTISIKPTVSDDRAPLWDGSHKEYKNSHFYKTVDWRDGVPIWDDSISHYKDKDFSDWFLEPMDEIYLGEIDMPVQDQVEELLIPHKPTDDLWSKKYQAQDLSCAVREAFETESDGCPFETEAECDIWRKKPMVRETVSFRSPKIRAEKMNEFIEAARVNNKLKATAPEAAPMLDRYKMLLKSARACCIDGMAHELKRAGASDGLVYKFLSDDANFYDLGNRCLMMSDKDFDVKYPNTATAAVASDVRNGCLCRGRQWFHAMLAPFADAYKTLPEFANAKFNYTYTDGLQREITVSVNNDVQNVLNQLSLCP
ncbi:MAG: hypothetical protein LBD50_01655 [Rickettsiales bacterium]|nr:hypothetical protein [Rickettsiales bacterium]